MTTDKPVNDSHLDCDVVVVGAGLSGLASAHLLCEAGLKTIVLEAADRIGGRIHSLWDSSSGDYIADLGPTWVWPSYQPIIAQWLERLDIRTFSQFESGNAVFEFDTETPVRHYPALMQHGIRRIHGGPQELINTLSSSLPKDTITTGHAVTAVAINEGTVVVSTASPTAPTIRAKRIVVAVPLRIASHTITWPPCLEKNILHQMSETPTWMATQAKAVVLYDEPFWRERELSGRVASQVGPLVEVHDHSLPDGGQACLFGFIGLPPGELRFNREKLQDQINQQLVRCFGEEAQKITEIHIEDWAINSLICTDLDLTTPPTHPEIVSDLLRVPHCGDRIYFSVAETALQSPGLIEGAFAASEITSKNLIASLHNK